MQEHARRHGRRVVQLTPPEVAAIRSELRGTLDVYEVEHRERPDRWMSQRIAAMRRVLAKLDALDA